MKERSLVDRFIEFEDRMISCLLYTSDAADDLLCVDLGGRRIIKKKKSFINNKQRQMHRPCTL